MSNNNHRFNVNIAIDSLNIDCSKSDALPNLNKHRSMPDDYKSVLKDNGSIDYESFDKLPEGIFNIKIGQAHFDCFFKDCPSERLYIMFRAAKGPDGKLVSFERWSYCNYLNAKILAINNPMYYLSSDLYCGWYLGTKEEDYIKHIVNFINKICKNYNINKKNVVFFGSSSGGTAAMHCSAYLPNTISFSLNPQFLPCTTNEGLVKDFEKIGIKLNEIPNERLHTLNLLQNSKSTHIICTNIRSDWDLEPLREVSKECKINLNYGINISYNKKILIWLYDAYGVTSAHGSFEDRTLLYMIDYLIDKCITHSEIDQRLFRIISEFWFEKYKNITEKILTISSILNDDKTLNQYQSNQLYKLHKNKWDNPDIWYQLAKNYRDGINVSKDIDTSLEYFRKVNESTGLHLNEYVDLLVRKATSESNKLAFDLVYKAANEGKIDAIYKLATYYKNGVGTEQNYPQSVSWFKKIITTNSKYIMEYCELLKKIGGTDNIEEVIKLYIELYNQGSPEAPLYLSKLYHHGTDTFPPNIEKAINWAKKSIEKGNIWANFELIGIYWNQKTHDEEMFKIAKDLSDKGNTFATAWMGMMYKDGRGTLQNIEKSIECFRQAPSVKWAQTELIKLEN